MDYEEYGIMQGISDFVSNTSGILTLGFVTYYLLGKSGQIASSLFKYVVHKPGVGVLTYENKKKTKVGIVKTESGDLNLPLMKMNSFDINFGFFTENFLQDEGFMTIDSFNEKYANNMSDMIPLKNIGNFWILNYRRPKDFFGRDVIHGYVESPLDNVIYLFKVENNVLIEYEKIIENYDNQLLDFANNVFPVEENTTPLSTPVPYEDENEEDQENISNSIIDDKFCFSSEEKRKTKIL